MKRPAIFFDRDNTLIVSDGYLGDPSAVTLVDGAADAVARARGLGFATVTISNQSGVARGMFGEEAVHAVNARVEELLKEQNPSAVIDRHEFCPFHPEAPVEQYRQDSDLRKPKPGMIFKAAEALALDLSKSWMIGDAPRDVIAGKAAGCRTILFIDPSLPPSPAAVDEHDGTPDYSVATLKGALDCIEQAIGVRRLSGEDTLQDPAPQDESAATDLPGGSDPAPSDEEAVRAETIRASALQTIGRTYPAAASSGETEIEAEAPATLAAHPKGRVPVAPAVAEPIRSEPVQKTASDESTAPPVDLKKLEQLAEAILHELRRQREPHVPDFSVSKLLAGVVQVMSVGVLIMSYFFRNQPIFEPTILVALTLQTLTISLMVMGRQ